MSKPPRQENWVPQHIVPEGEGKLSEAVTVRLPKTLLEFIELAADASGNNRSDTILHMLRWAKREIEKSKGKKP